MIGKLIAIRSASFFRLAARLAFCAFASMAAAQPTATTVQTSSRLVGFSGIVEITLAGTNDWHPAQTNLVLHPGDRVRTGIDSRATLQLSDRSVIRINQSTLLEIQPAAAPARHRFGLKKGVLYFLDREQPADVEFETPLATGAIRGTEFLLQVDPLSGASRLAIIDGVVELQTTNENLHLTNGQEVLLEAGQPVRMTAVLSTVNLIQWSFYYPAVLNPQDIPFTPSEDTALAKSLADYSAGNLLAALSDISNSPASDAVRTYYAGLKLAAGQVDGAESLLPANDENATVLRELIAAVKFETVSPLGVPTNSSGWLARSYYLQSRSQLQEALAAASQSARMAPEFGFAWARVAELQFGAGYFSEARAALARARQFSPANAQTIALEGFIALAQNHPHLALNWFDTAIATDGSLPSAWVGHGLAEAQLQNNEEARRNFQVAATLEPTRGLFRTYLGKAWSQTGNDRLAEKDFSMAKNLDPADPTAWLYSALQRFQTHQVNAAVRDLEQSKALNDNRAIFRSRLQLDQDRATRSADLAAIYSAAGMTEVSQSSASRAVEESYSDFAGHLFLADSLAQQEDPQRYDLRNETARESEQLVANLLAPSGGGNLSQLLSQQDRLQYFDLRPFGVSSLSAYDSHGNFNQAATAFGSVGDFSYAFDAQYISQNGDRLNNKLEDRQFSVQAKQQITSRDSLYLQVGYFRGDNGDVAPYYDPNSASPSFHAIEEQRPNLFFGGSHEWSPGSHTLFLLSRLTDRLSLTNPQPSVLFMAQDGPGFYGVAPDPYFSLSQAENFTLYSGEIQQIWESQRQAFIIGGRYQHGTIDTHANLTRLFGQSFDQTASPDLERLNGYAYYQWRPITALRFTAGLSYDHLTYPQNVDLPPVETGESHRSLLGPKVGFSVQPWRGGWVHGAWTRSLGGLFFDNSIRLEPTQVAGELSAFRSLVPESVEGVVPGARFDSWSIGFDQALPSNTYFGIEGKFLYSDAVRDVGAFSNSIPFIPAPNAPSSTPQALDYRERRVDVYVNQLLGCDWATGARYELTEAKLQTSLTALAGVPGVSSVDQNERALLNHGQIFLIYNHPSGFFAEWSSDWYLQSNHGYSPAVPGDDFWQHNIYAGYVFPHRRAELRLGLLNLADQDYHLNPLNSEYGLVRGRTFTASLRINF